MSRMQIVIGDPHDIRIRRAKAQIGQLDVILPLDLNINDPSTALMSTIVLTLAAIGSQLADVQTVLAAMPGCGRPVEGSPSLFVATDAMRDALVRIHDAVDARTAALAATAEQAGDPNVQ